MNTLQNAKAYEGTRRARRLQQLRELSMRYEGSEENIPLRPPDISPQGMFINTSAHFLEGAIVNLRFRLTHSNVEVQTRGEVRYCLTGIGVGVEFIGIRPEAARAIEKEVKALTRSHMAKS